MAVIITDSDAFPVTLTVPAAGDPASAPTLVSQFLQGIANRTRWLWNRIQPLVVGGTLGPAATLHLVSLSGSQITVNDLTTYADADGGLVSIAGTSGLYVSNGNITALKSINAVGNLGVTGTAAIGTSLDVGGYLTAVGLVTASAGVRAPKRMVTVTPVAGTHTISPVNWDIVITTTAVPAGTNWKLDNAGVNIGESLLIANLDTTHAQPILIQDSSGTTITTIIYVAGQPFVVMAVFLGGTAWQIIPITYHP